MLKYLLPLLLTACASSYKISENKPACDPQNMRSPSSAEKCGGVFAQGLSTNNPRVDASLDFALSFRNDIFSFMNPNSKSFKTALELSLNSFVNNKELKEGSPNSILLQSMIYAADNNILPLFMDTLVNRTYGALRDTLTTQEYANLKSLTPEESKALAQSLRNFESKLTADLSKTTLEKQEPQVQQALLQFLQIMKNRIGTNDAKDVVNFADPHLAALLDWNQPLMVVYRQFVTVLLNEPNFTKNMQGIQAYFKEYRSHIPAEEHAVINYLTTVTPVR